MNYSKKKKQITVCRACGAPLEVKNTTEVLLCSACGARQLFPFAITDAETLALYTDAYRFLANGEFYSALRMFEALIKTRDTVAARAGAVLAKYGVTGVREFMKIETAHRCTRANPAAPEKDPDYIAALALAGDAERTELEKMCAFIVAEQKRLNDDTKVHKEKEPSGLADEFTDAQKKAEEKKKREAERLEAERNASREAELRRAEERKLRMEKARKKEKLSRLLRILIPAAVLCVALFISVVNLIIPAIRYGRAKEYIEQQNYSDAAVLLRALDGYRDSGALLEKYRFYGLKAGDTVTLGNYPQTADGQYRPIEWIVLSVDENEALLISKYVLDVQKYNTQHISVTWETSTLRNWLNNDFCDTAFSVYDAERVLTVTNENPDNTLQGTIGGNATQDRAFCLSAAEAEKYLIAAGLGGAEPTGYSYAKEIYQDSEGGTENSWYWLRTPGSSQSTAAKMDYDGTVNYRGTMCHYEKYGVRPAIVIRVNG